MVIHPGQTCDRRVGSWQPGDRLRGGLAGNSCCSMAAAAGDAIYDIEFTYARQRGDTPHYQFDVDPARKGYKDVTAPSGGVPSLTLEDAEAYAARALNVDGGVQLWVFENDGSKCGRKPEVRIGRSPLACTERERDVALHLDNLSCRSDEMLLRHACACRSRSTSWTPTTGARSCADGGSVATLT